jgi:hypothetical protein
MAGRAELGFCYPAYAARAKRRDVCPLRRGTSQAKRNLDSFPRLRSPGKGVTFAAAQWHIAG